MMGYGFGLLGSLGMIIPVILIVLVIYAVVKLAQGNNSFSSGKKEENEALDILSQRYAKGEISDEEYMQKKKILKG